MALPWHYFAADWARRNLVLPDGVPGVERDTGKIKIGDGTTAWNSLTYKDTPPYVIPEEDTVSETSLSASRRLRPVAATPWVFSRSSTTQSDGVVTQQTSQNACTALTDFAGLRLVYGNMRNDGGAEADGATNAITVRAVIRVASDGTNVPVYFNGKRSVVIEPGGIVMSDIIPITRAKGEMFYPRSHVAVASGERFPLGPTTSSVVAEWATNTESLETSAGASIVRAYMPLAVLGIPTKSTESPVLLLVGDSKTAGSGETFSGYEAYGWARRAFDGKFSYLNLGLSGSGALSSHLHARRRLALADTCGLYDAVIAAYGINDVQGVGITLDTLKARLTALWTVLAARGPVYAATIEPYATSTDTWATVQNQTPHVSNALRVQLNDWIRTKPSALLAGVLEFADAVESSRNSGVWKPGHTGDSIHPNATGHAAIAAVVSAMGLSPAL